MRIRHGFTTATAAAALIAALSAAPAAAQQESSAAAQPDGATGEAATAGATLMDGDGQEVGTVAVVETPNGLIVQLEAEGLPAGGHGFHIHTTGQCDAPDFESAGGHYNPNDRPHGMLSEEGPHTGDLPNVWASENGAIRADFFVHDLSLTGGEMALLDDDGSAFMIHAEVDDYETDPGGDAGDRIACGVLEQSEAPAPGGTQTQSQ